MPDLTFGLTSTDWTAIGTGLNGVTLLITGSAAAVAFRQWKLREKAREDAQKAAIEASRPYVIVALEPGRANPAILDITICNLGQRPAKDIKIMATPPLRTTNDAYGFPLSDARMFSQPMAMLSPDQQLRVMFDSLAAREKLRGTEQELPSCHELTISYQDTSGHDYTETCTIDADLYRGALYTDVQTIHDVAKSIEKIAQTLKGSALASQGSIQVEAIIETPVQRVERTSAENEASRELLDQMRAENRDAIR